MRSSWVRSCSGTPSNGFRLRPPSSATLQVTVAALDVAERLQDERDISGLFDVGATGQGAVADARNATDEAIDAFNDRLAELPDDVDPAVAEARRSTTVQLALLNAYRGSRDIVLEPFDESGVEDYHHMINSLFRFVKASGTQSADPELVLQIDALDSLAGHGVGLGRAGSACARAGLRRAAVGCRAATRGDLPG